MPSDRDGFSLYNCSQSYVQEHSSLDTSWKDMQATRKFAKELQTLRNKKSAVNKQVQEQDKIKEKTSSFLKVIANILKAFTIFMRKKLYKLEKK